MKKILLLIIFIIGSLGVYAQQTKISGIITDSLSGAPIPRANINIKGTITGAVAGLDGKFSLTVAKLKLPFTLVISSLGHTSKQIDISMPVTNIDVRLKSSSVVLNEVVTAATRLNQNILQSPVSIEKMTQKTIKENPSFTFYDGLQSLKGVDVVTSGLTYKQVNTRGFNDTGNPRFLQLIDGVDNQTPGLNFAVGNLFGVSDIDIESVEVVPGAASVLYGPDAFNGAMLMHTKDPFRYQGLTLQVKTGLNHVGESGVNPKGLYDYALRYAKAFNNKFAFKVNASYLTGTDWYADNYTDVNYSVPPNMRGPNDPGRDALNIYGDEISRTLPGIGTVSRTGYEEKYLMNYGVYSLNLNGQLAYRINNNLEAIYQYNYGRGTASYTGSSRYDLNDFVLQTHRLELKGNNFFLRSYVVMENSGNSYNTRTLGEDINREWVQDLNGNVVSPANADNMWFTRYADAYNGAINGVAAHDNNAARAFADEGRYLPGTTAFNQAKNASIHDYSLSGAGVISKSKYYHTEGQYDFSNAIKLFNLLVGGDYRLYDMFSDGTLFDDLNHKITIGEFGAFAQASKKLLDDKLNVIGSIRYDKDENFAGSFTPRIAAVYSVAPDQNIRASYQTGFRNPTPVDQYIHLNVGPITILGGVPNNSKGLPAYTNSYTAASVSAFGAAFGQEVGGGASFQQAVNDNKHLLQKSDVPYIKPEQEKSFEIGYKGLLNKKLLLDVNYYYSTYTDFILNTVVIAPGSNVIGTDGTPNAAAAQDILNGNEHAYQLYTNAPDKVSAQGSGVSLTWMMDRGYTLTGNGMLSVFTLGKANRNDVAEFNTPEYSTNVVFANSNVFKGYGFNVSWHWQSAFDWYGTFNGENPGRINAYSLVDMQVNKKLPKLKATVMLGASNLFNNHVYQAYGSPAIGGIYYVEITFDNLL